MLRYRRALREALGRLDWANGPVLVASFTSTDRRPYDVENLLLYNVGLSAFAHLSCKELVLTRSFAPPVSPAGRRRQHPRLPPPLPEVRRLAVGSEVRCLRPVPN